MKYSGAGCPLNEAFERSGHFTCSLMQRLFDLIAQWLFPGRQGWEQRKKLQIWVSTLVFALTLGLILIKIICLMHPHR
jgi:hypothetical protein